MLRILKEKRKRMGLTQAELAKAAGIEKWLYTKLESGKKGILDAPFGVVYRIHKFMDIPIEDLAEKTTAENETDEGTEVYLRIKKKDVDAKGIYYKNTNQLIVLPGSRVSRKCRLAEQKRVGDEERRKKLETDGVIIDRVFTREYCFRSPSLAATLISGISLSGTASWKTEEGISLGELKELRTAEAQENVD